MPTLPSETTVRIAGVGEMGRESGYGPESTWITRQVEAMVAAWGRGERLTAAEILALHPGLDTEAAIRLIYEEVCLRRESGQEVATAEVVRRFPHWKDELEILLGCDRMLRPHASAVAFPEVGDVVGPFRLRAELGQGAFGEDVPGLRSLAGRPAGRFEGHPRRPRRASVAGSDCSTRTSSRCSRSRRCPTAVFGRSACPTSAARACPGFWRCCPSSRPSGAAAIISSRPSTVPRSAWRP